jgi:hypothetical protein
LDIQPVIAWSACRPENRGKCLQQPALLVKGSLIPHLKHASDGSGWLNQQAGDGFEEFFVKKLKNFEAFSLGIFRKSIQNSIKNLKYFSTFRWQILKNR